MDHVSEIKFVDYIKLKLPISKLFTTTICAQSDHRFHELMHAVEHAIVEQLARWFCGWSDAALQQDAA